jgi:ribosomal protein S18 acetylase RimI-like enzyme
MCEVLMENNNLILSEVYDLPSDYKIVFYRDGDEKAWIDIHLDADKYNKINIDVFRDSFGYNTEIQKQRQLYLYYKNKIIGTSSAWFDKDYKEGKFGRVHWVAIKEEYQGKGLAKSLLYYTCKTLLDLGHKKAFLTTDTRRPYAIKLYEKFGFKIV